MIDYSEVFVYSNQPTICPKCSSRTDIILDLSHTKSKTQIHKCIDEKCESEFVMEHDEEFEEYDMKVLENDEKEIGIFV